MDVATLDALNTMPALQEHAIKINKLDSSAMSYEAIPDGYISLQKVIDDSKENMINEIYLQ